MIPAASLLPKHTVILIAHTEITKKLTVWSPLATDVRQSAAAVHGLAVAEIGGLVAIVITAIVPGAGGIIAESAITARSVIPKSVLAISVAVPVVAVVAVIPVAITSAPAIAVPRTRAGAGT